MPIYEYRRPDGTTFEVQQAFTDEPLARDPDTGVPVTRVLHAPALHFKGSGFYNTDYGTRKRQRELAAASNGDGKDSSGDSASADSSSSDSSSKDGESGPTASDGAAKGKGGGEGGKGGGEGGKGGGEGGKGGGEGGKGGGEGAGQAGGKGSAKARPGKSASARR